MKATERIKNGIPLIMAFSGGESSFYALKLLLEEYYDKQPIYIFFCNTGLEDEETLIFVQKTEDYFRSLGYDIKIIWLEYRPKRNYEIVNFETAYRCLDKDFEKGYLECPMTYYCFDYDLPEFLHRTCTRELKLRTINRYLNDLNLEGLKSVRVVGIRFDEIGKRGLNLIENYYPLVKYGITKPNINIFFRDNIDFRLELPSFCGNCGACTQKELYKIVYLARIKPHYFNWWKWFSSEVLKKDFKYWENYNGVEDVFEKSKKENIRVPIDERNIYSIQLNLIESLNDLEVFEEKKECSESCEPFEYSED